MSADDLALHAASPADLPALHRLIESAYRGEAARAGWTHEADLLEGARTSAEDLAAILADPDAALLTVRDADTIVGCVHLARTAPGTVYLGMLTVDPQRQAAGLGRRIMAAAECVAVARFGAVRMELSVVTQRAELIAYYERRGYARTGELRPFPVPLDPPFFLMVMAKRLGGVD